MSSDKNNELEQRIFLNVETCFRNRGLIKMRNRHEHYVKEHRGLDKNGRGNYAELQKGKGR